MRPRQLQRRFSAGLSLVLSPLASFMKGGWKRHLRPPPARWGTLGVQRSLADEFTFLCLEMAWGRLLAFVTCSYILVALLFAVLFWLLIVLSPSDTHLFGDIPPGMGLPEACWWFSVHNCTTIGFAELVPGSTRANLLATTEHFVGILMSSVLLGIVVTKASLPSANLVFSSRVLFTTRNSVPHVLLRVGNIRGNFLMNPEIRLSYMQRLVTSEGEVGFKGQRMSYDDPPSMAPCVNIAHEITETSPLWGKSAAEIELEEGAIIVSIAAVDDVSLQASGSRNQRQWVDFTKFDETVPLGEHVYIDQQELSQRLAQHTISSRGVAAAHQKPLCSHIRQTSALPLALSWTIQLLRFPLSSRQHRKQQPQAPPLCVLVAAMGPM
eukprot:jgi/Astpho2/9457/fgenesh1_pg.00145_%23_62_t